MGFDITEYKNLNTWYKNCATLPGYEENEAGCVILGNVFKGLLQKWKVWNFHSKILLNKNVFLKTTVILDFIKYLHKPKRFTNAVLTSQIFFVVKYL